MMKFKENAIKPGVVIHCPKEEDARELLEHLYDNLGFFWGGKKEGVIRTLYENGDCYHIDSDNVKRPQVLVDTEEWFLKNHMEVTEFSDLIEPDEPQMTAEELMRWLMEHYRDGTFKDAFDLDYSFEELISKYEDNAGEIIDKITAYEATKKKKPVEVEEGWHIEVYEENGDLWNKDSFWFGYTKEEVESIAKRVAIDCVRQTGRSATWSVIDACKVKEDK